MAGAGKAGLGIGTAAAGGAASGAAFGPIGAGVGAGIGGLLGLWGALEGEDEDDLKRKRDKARQMAAVEVLRNRAAKYGAPTDDLDMTLKLNAIDDQYQQARDAQSQVGPQDIMGFTQAAASLGREVGDWTKAPAPLTGEPVRNSDLYGAPNKQGLVYDTAAGAGPNTTTDPLGVGAPSMTPEELKKVSDEWYRRGK